MREELDFRDFEFTRSYCILSFFHFCSFRRYDEIIFFPEREYGNQLRGSCAITRVEINRIAYRTTFYFELLVTLVRCTSKKLKIATGDFNHRLSEFHKLHIKFALVSNLEIE